MNQKVYPLSLDSAGVADKLEQTFKLEGYEVQRLGSPNDLYVQIRKGGLARTVVGMSQALTIQLQNTGAVKTVTLGQSKWMDKAAAETVGFVVFLPLMVTGFVGIYEQHKLPGKVWNVIDTYASVQGAASTQTKTAQLVHCPHCGVSNGEEAKFCNACGAQLKAQSFAL